MRPLDSTAETPAGPAVRRDYQPWERARFARAVIVCIAVCAPITIGAGYVVAVYVRQLLASIGVLP